MEKVRIGKLFIDNHFDRESLKGYDITGSSDEDYDVDLEDIYTENLEYLINDFPHYLVVLFESTWRNQTGAKIFHDKVEGFYRSYDCSQYVTGSSIDGKYLELRETHHDKPMGHKTLIVGLTENEYEILDRLDLKDVIRFAEKKLKNIIEI